MTDKKMQGALIERGVIESVGEKGYRVKSLTRYPIVTPEIAAIGDNMITMYDVGDIVYFFMFPDGNGMILAGC